KDPRLRVATTDAGSLTYLAIGFSAGAGALEDARVRRALRLALDLPALVEAGTIAGGTPAGRIIPPGSFGFDPERKPPRRDLAAARRLLEEAGYPNGFDQDLDVGPNARRAGQTLAAQAAEAGIRLRVVVRRPDDFVSRIDGRSPLYLYSWFVGRDAGQALRNAFHTRDAARGLGSMNRTEYSSAAVDAAFARLAAATRAEERLARLREVSDLLDEDLPWIPLYSARQTRILPAWLDLLWRPDGLFVIAEARPAGGGRCPAAGPARGG
ncbi:MAG: ABC transporter substrate-binding protein, partial [Thermoanaerobaculia bacterium]